MYLALFMYGTRTTFHVRHMYNSILLENELTYNAKISLSRVKIAVF